MSLCVMDLRLSDWLSSRTRQVPGVTAMRLFFGFWLPLTPRLADLPMLKRRLSRRCKQLRCRATPLWPMRYRGSFLSTIWGCHIINSQYPGARYDSKRKETPNRRESFPEAANARDRARGLFPDSPPAVVSPAYWL